MKHLLFIIISFFSTAALSKFETLPYGPPSHYDALVAFQEEIIEKSSASYYATWGADISLQNNYPVDVQVVRCEADEGGRLPGTMGGEIIQDGFHCVVDIFPNAEPAYRVFGFFFYDGITWQYYGPTGPNLLIPVHQYDPGETASSRTPKPGSILYDGQPFGKQNLQNPYKDILNYEFNQSRQK